MAIKLMAVKLDGRGRERKGGRNARDSGQGGT